MALTAVLLAPTATVLAAEAQFVRLQNYISQPGVVAAVMAGLFLVSAIKILRQAADEAASLAAHRPPALG